MSTAAADAAAFERAEEQAPKPLPAIVNQLNKCLIITGSDGTTFTLAPLERRDLTREIIESLRSALRTLQNLHYVVLEPPRQPAERWAPLTFGLGFWIVLGAVIYGFYPMPGAGTG